MDPGNSIPEGIDAKGIAEVSQRHGRRCCGRALATATPRVDQMLLDTFR
jgi:hypothetical protein